MGGAVTWQDELMQKTRVREAQQKNPSAALSELPNPNAIQTMLQGTPEILLGDFSPIRHDTSIAHVAGSRDLICSVQRLHVHLQIQAQN